MGFQQGLSGLNAASRNLDVIGHNIANANTVGAKASRAEFADMYATSFNALSGAPGIGVRQASIAQQFTQGSITTTGNATDLAINGAGFFQMQDSNGAVQYSRNGQFKIDKDGYVVNNQGSKLMGYQATAAGVIQPGTSVPLMLPTAGVDPIETTNSTLELNLDSRVAVTNLGGVAAATPDLARINIQDPKTYNNATSTTVYDVKGQPVTMTYYFQKAGQDTWNVYATANGQSVNGITTPAEAVTNMAPIATVTFPVGGGNPISVPATTVGVTPYTYATTGTQTPGTIVTSTGTIPLPTIPAVTLSTGGLSEPIPAPPGTTAVQLDMKGFTQYGSGFGVTNVNVDGNAPGALTGIAFEADGTVTARYSNGKTRPAGQVELANFRNPNGLEPIGGNAWAMTAASGDAVRNIPGAGNLGALQAGAVEESNVDLTAELVNMMTAQRIYQANAQTVKTEDQVLNTLVNLR